MWPDFVYALYRAFFNRLPYWLRPRYILDVRARAGHWRVIRAAQLVKCPECEACMRVAELDVHHVIPVSFDPSKELDPSNLMTLCPRCHIVFGHLGSFHCYNKDVRKMVAEYRKAVLGRRCLKT